jgi:hypothetical protein
MRALTVAVLVAVIALSMASSASAFEGGGRKPSEAPLITVGQHYTGQLNNHKDDSNYGGYREVALWRLPPLTTRDVVTVDWNSAPFTESPGDFPICLVLLQGVDDFNWGSIFGNLSGYCYRPSGSGSAKSEIVVQESTTNTSYLGFFASAQETNPAYYETFPYDFTVQPILHYLAVAAKPVKRVSANGVLRATANLATGLPAPDGTPFSLSVSWANGGVAGYAGVSAGGGVGFQLALPETAFGKSATFVVTHPADGTYQAATAPRLVAKVAKPKAPVATPCELARSHAHVLARQHRRLLRNVDRAHGANRRSLRRRASRVGRKLKMARSQAASACAVP